MKRTWSVRNFCWLALLALVTGPEAGRAQTAQVSYPDFSSVKGLGLQGSAIQSGQRVRLTGATPWQTGGLWPAARRYVAGGFETVFQFQITERGGVIDGTNVIGGEGFAFVVQNNVLPALGPAGDGLGYDGVPASLAVEFDVRANAGRNDPNGNHISVHTALELPNGADHTNSLGSVTGGLPDMADGQVHTAKILCTEHTLQVFLDDLNQAVLAVDLPAGAAGGAGSLSAALSLDDGQAWLGFTAATGEAYEQQDLLSWSFVPAPGPVTISVTSPLSGASYVAPANITLAAAATSTGVVALVEFYEGTTKLGETNVAPCVFSWNNVVPGHYWVTALATDEAGNRRASAPIELTVYPPAPPVGLNFSTGLNGSNYPLGLTEQAGAVEQRLWNNLVSSPDGSGFSLNPRDGGGAQTSLQVFWDFARPEEASWVNPEQSSDYKLMKPFLADHGGSGGSQSNSYLVVQNIRYPVYDVLVYAEGAASGGSHVAEFRIGNSSIFLREAPWADFAGSYVEAEGISDQREGTPAGNYVRFNSLSNSSFTLTVTARSASDGLPRATVNAVQIVPSVRAARATDLQLTRGPYLQAGTPSSMVVRWRTSQVTDTRVRYGLSPTELTMTNDDAGLTIEHIVTLTNLEPATRYYYAVGTSGTNLAGGADCYLITSPTNPVPTRVWFISDYGFKDSGERSVRNSYFNFIAPEKPADVWLTGGDNDQTDGTDANDQTAIFGTNYGYGALLRNLPMRPTIGNHDYQTANGQAFYANFSMPTNGEAGGVPSGSQHYYSYNYGDIHFINLDSIDGSLSISADTPMLQWLRQDLASTTQRWIIAHWHGPPYTKGTHDSDSESDTLSWMIQMRQNVVPLLEAYGVDLVLCGHSHVYERSWLLHGHYGFSDTFSETNKVDGGDGKEDGTGAYVKAVRGAGTVYVTAAVGGQPQADHFAGYTHPTHLLKIANTFGSLVIDISSNRLDLKFVGVTGAALDHFTLLKDLPTTVPLEPTDLAASVLSDHAILLRWSDLAKNEMFYKLERSVEGGAYAEIATIGANLTNYVDNTLPLTVPRSYRLWAWNAAGYSPDYSNIVTVGTPPLRLSSLRCSGGSVTLSWQSVPGKTYAIQWKERLDDSVWHPALENVPATGYTATRELPLPAGVLTGFYRVQLSGN
jgi:acid phosphatase type 7